MIPVRIGHQHRGDDRQQRYDGGNRSEGANPPGDEATQRHPDDAADQGEVAASTRNWNMISRRVAPSALRTPISRVRSVTEIIMMATTPTPPTMSPTPDSASITRKKPLVILFQVSRILSWLTRAKLLSCAGLRLRDDRIAGGDLVHRLIHRGPGLGAHGDLHPALPVIADLDEGRMGNGDGGRVVVAEEALRLGVQPHHFERLSRDLDPLADRVAAGKSCSASLLLITRDPCARRFFEIRVVTSLRDGSSYRTDPARAESGGLHTPQVHVAVGDGSAEFPLST